MRHSCFVGISRLFKTSWFLVCPSTVWPKAALIRPFDGWCALIERMSCQNDAKSGSWEGNTDRWWRTQNQASSKSWKKWSRWAAAVLLLHFHTCVPWQIGECTPITLYLMHVCILWTKRVGPNFNLLSRNLHISAPIHLPHLLLLPSSPGLQDLAWRKALLLNSILSHFQHMGIVFLKFVSRATFNAFSVMLCSSIAIKLSKWQGMLEF